MNFHFVPMTTEYAKAIAGWHYDGVFAFYDFDQDPEDLAELLDPRAREGKYFAVLNKDNELTGFFCFDVQGGSVEMGLGLKPSETGKGLGRVFVQTGMAFAKERLRPMEFRLQVAKFNQRAIRMYEKLGFRIEKTFLMETNGGEYEFVSMVREADARESGENG